MSEFPIQTRTIDPYSSYNSNVVNQLTRMITRGKNCLHGVHAIDVVIDSTSSDTEIVILPGEGFKDDVIIQIGERKTVDMTDMNYYINHINPFNEAGYYYVCIEYIYAKARPAPEAKIRLLKPSQTHLYDADNSAFLLLKVVNIIFNGVTFEVDELFDYDPSNPTVVKVYSQLYAGAEDSLPVFDQMRDEGRLVYAKDRDEMFFGIENRWESFNAVRSNIDTSACESGDVGYIDENGEIQLAIAQSLETLADCIVLTSDIGDQGKVRLFGETTSVRLETGMSIGYGESLYLSENEAGSLTNMRPFQFPQFVGISISSGVVSGECDMWFLPDRASANASESNTIDFYQDLLNNSIFTYLFIEGFGNDDFIDSTSTSLINTYDYSVEGGTGDEIITEEIQVSTFGTNLKLAQISARCECETGASIDWYISNNGDDDWEETELDKLHNFSTYGLEFLSGTGTFVVGEVVTSSVTGKSAIINGINNGRILVSGDTRLTMLYNIGETLTGLTSGATGVISVVIDRNDPSYHDLRIKIVFNGNPKSCKIYDYGVIYDQDEDIFNEEDNDLQQNLDTVYLDMYTHPHQDNDGNPNLIVPLETQIQMLDETCSSQIYQIETQIQMIDESCCSHIEQMESDIDYLFDSIDTTSSNGMILVNDNDIETIYKDVYTSPSRDNDGDANLVTPLETLISQLRTDVNNISTGGTNPALFVTTADATPDVNANPSIVRVDYASPLTITNFLNGVIGQEVTIVFTNDQTVISNNANIFLSAEIDFLGKNNIVLTLVHNGSIWIEKSSSDVYVDATVQNSF